MGTAARAGELDMLLGLTALNALISNLNFGHGLLPL
jgi:hypothetical protein